ncbi:MAG TPA: aldo/keto reductase [Gemmataceae bacterium]|nr:aldo/keto reductase [Gemmataceae bacterium]
MPNRSFRHDPTIADIDANLARVGGVGYNIGSMQPLNPSANCRLTTLDGTPASCLGLAAGPKQDPRCVRRAFARGINYFFFYGPGNTSFIEELASLVPRKREQIIVATGSGSRRVAGLRAARRKLTALLGIELIDVFFIEYVHPGDNPDVMFGKNGVLGELRQWKESGLVRFVGATAHDRSLARRLAADPRVDVLMHRFNMAHRKAAHEVFPAAAKARTPIVAFTATRWGTLLKPYADWPGPPPTASDCYRYCLSQPSVHVVLTAPRSLAELEQNLDVLELPPMSKQKRDQWQRFGDLVYGAGKGAFETSWP